VRRRRFVEFVIGQRQVAGRRHGLRSEDTRPGPFVRVHGRHARPPDLPDRSGLRGQRQHPQQGRPRPRQLYAVVRREDSHAEDEGANYFADGAKVTADDVAFSYERLIGIAGNPAFLLEDPNGDPIKVSQPDKNTVVLTSGVANPSLPFILPNPSLGIVEKKVVLKHGGTTDANDQAGSWLTSNSAGSGPYVVKSADVKSQVKLAANPHYAGTKPAYSNVVVQNVTSATQKVNIQAGTSQMAFDLSADDAKSLNSGQDQGRYRPVDLHAVRLVQCAGEVRQRGVECEVRPGHAPRHRLQRDRQVHGQRLGAARRRRAADVRRLAQERPQQLL
jgi:hypothetical protein